MNMNELQIERTLKVLGCANGLLKEVIDSKKWIEGLDKIAIALINIKIVMNKTNTTNYDYEDVLTLEETLLKNKWVDFFNPISCRTESISFGEIRALEDTFVYTSDKNYTPHQLPAKYKTGNRAIGQVYVDGKEGFCKKMAVEHSIESIAHRWYSCSYNLISNVKDTGHLVRPCRRKFKF